MKRKPQSAPKHILYLPRPGDVLESPSRLERLIVQRASDGLVGLDNSIVGVNLMCRHHRWYKRLFYNGWHITANHMPSQSYESLNALIYTFGWRIIERGPAPENEE